MAQSYKLFQKAPTLGSLIDPTRDRRAFVEFDQVWPLLEAALSAGTLIDAAGQARKLSKGDFTLEPVEREGKYPVVWRIRIPALAIDIVCRAVLRNQELRARQGGPSYWEGAVNYTGSHKGVGYLEMTGYDAPVKLP